MNRKLILIINVLFLGLLIGCVQNGEPTINNSSTNIAVSSYFPPVGLERTYIQYGTTGENILSNDTVKSEVDSSGKESLYIHEKGGLAVERVTEYKVNDHSIRVVYRINAFMNKEVDELELTNRKSWNVGDSDNSIRYLTNENLKITVPAGTFQDCIEITQVTGTEGNGNTSIYYYAPTVGLVKTVWKLDGEKFTAMELQSFSKDTEQDSEGKSQEEGSVIGGGIEESPSPKFQSGSLLHDTNLISTLNINDYMNRVNQYSIEQVEYYLLHRPTFEETNNGTTLYFSDDITIRCDTSGNIMEVMMQQDTSLTEETFLYIQWLILGLDSKMSIEEANEIIFPKESNQVFKVGEFNVGIMADSNGFTFKAIPY
ncbi:hypothetical protein [Exiguobacterium sp. s123]|uniref:hypothetical protein n=1 Tax=Exiguobacterium sp. s123 TaxID=2751289 RepID=UPI001BEA2DC0|nr:hypothetical protein [Exiguobacterium sp. s123]